LHLAIKPSTKQSMSCMYRELEKHFGILLYQS